MRNGGSGRRCNVAEVAMKWSLRATHRMAFKKVVQRLAPGVSSRENAAETAACWLERELRSLGRENLLIRAAQELRDTGKMPEFANDILSLRSSLEGSLRVWLLSDLHFGCRHQRLRLPVESEKEGRLLTDSILNLASAKDEVSKPDIVIVSGDLTWQADVGYRYARARAAAKKRIPAILQGVVKEPEFAAARTFLDNLANTLRRIDGISGQRRIVVVPGNHDVAWLGEKRPLDTFRTEISGTKYTTPFSPVGKIGRLPGARMEVRTTSAPHDAPFGVVKFVVRGFELVAALVVSHFWEGGFANSQRLAIDRKAKQEVEEVRHSIQRNGWASIPPARFSHVLEVVERFAIHDPVVTANYINATYPVLRKVVGDDPSDSQTRVCVAHAPLAQIGGATGDILFGGQSLWAGWNYLFGSKEHSFHAVLSGHLHSVGSKYDPDLKGWIISAGTAGARINPDAIPRQIANSFWELELSEEAGVTKRSCIPIVWNGEVWTPDEKSRIDMDSQDA